VTLPPSRRPPAQVLPRATLAFARPVARSLKAKAVGSFLPSLTAQAFKKFGFSTAQLMMEWPAIVGRELAARCVPERLKWPPRPDEADAGEVEPERGRRGATLLLRVDGAHALDIDYQRQQIVDRVNAYFGYRAVSELRLVQAPLPASPEPERPRRLKAGAPARGEVAGIADAGLREALARLGSRLAAR
jgi:hypothetical protein